MIKFQSKIAIFNRNKTSAETKTDFFYYLGFTARKDLFTILS